MDASSDCPFEESESDSESEDSDEEESSETTVFFGTCVFSLTEVCSSTSEPDELSSEEEEDEDSEEEATRLFLFLFRFLEVFAAFTALF